MTSRGATSAPRGFFVIAGRGLPLEEDRGKGRRAENLPIRELGFCRPLRRPRVFTAPGPVCRDFAMISLLPDEVIRAACQLACCGFAAFTAVVAFVFTPR